MPAKLVYRVHAITRMFEREISEEEVRKAINDGETTERYPNDTPLSKPPGIGAAGGPTDTCSDCR
jgi:hypothetical protein